MSEKHAGGKRWTVGITDYVAPPPDIESEAFPAAEFRFLSDWRTSEAALAEWRASDALLVWHWHVDRETVGVLDRCRVVVRYGVGYDLVDVAALAERGIPFCNTPDYGTEEVADLACAMILAVQRRLVEYDARCRGHSDSWQENVLEPQRRTSHSVLGIVGVGRIGTAVVNRMKPFGFGILGYDPYQPSGHEKAVGYERVESLDELLERSDVVSVHCPLTTETRAMIDAAFLGRMKPGSSLVNTARGGILAGLDCLEEALRSGRLASAALDVLPDEPPRDHALIRAWREREPWLAGRLTVTPHTAWYSERAWYEMRYKAAQTARLFLETGRLRNRVTAEVRS